MALVSTPGGKRQRNSSASSSASRPVAVTASIVRPGPSEVRGQSGSEEGAQRRRGGDVQLGLWLGERVAEDRVVSFVE
jgi:hypothetical protein